MKPVPWRGILWGWYYSTQFKEQLTFELAAFERVGPPLLIPSYCVMRKRT